MGKSQKQPFQLSFNPSLKVDFQGSRVTSDGGLILVRELDERLGFSDLIEQLFGRRDGWLRMAWMLIGIGILGTFAAAPGSLEGFIFTKTPALSQTKGYLEVVTQAVLLSALLCYWVNHPGKKWMNWTLGVGYALCAGLPLLALVAPKR